MKQAYLFFFLLMLIFGSASPGFSQSDAGLLIGTISEVKAAYKSKAAQATARSRSGSNNQIRHRLPGQEPLVINVQSSREDAVSETFYGEIEAIQNSQFHLKIGANEVSGSILLVDQKKYFRYVATDQQLVYLQEEKIDSVLCMGFPKVPESAGPVKAEATKGAGNIPVLESLPGARSVIFLDFDGHTVKNTIWNDSFTRGETIEAAPSDLAVTEMVEAWKIMAEDFKPFELNVTTDEAVFNKTAPNRRMRVIFTPTNYFFPGWGGVAYIGSFNWGSSSYGETPCWVWNALLGKYAGETGSHEVGHTLNLLHDGRTNPPEEYYYGHDRWAPIMGAGFFMPVVQWSKGEYTHANNFEDDLGIIAAFPGVGLRTDDHGNSNSTASRLLLTSEGDLESEGNKGLIATRTDVDVFRFETPGGIASITVRPTSEHPNLAIRLTVKNAEDKVIAVGDERGMSAYLNTNLPAGTYFLQVEGRRSDAGEHSDYASVGEYVLQGTVQVRERPVITITSPTNGATFTSPATIEVTTTHDPTYPNLVMVVFLVNGEIAGDDREAPFTFTLTSLAAGTYNITAQAIDPRKGIVGVSTVTVQVQPGVGAGGITRELWTDVHGPSISAIPIHTKPTTADELPMFETPANIGDNYGQRVRGFVQAPESGEYTFWIAADDVAELWLSTSENPEQKAKIAQVDRWTYSREWTKYETQQSAKVMLEAGKRYYIEALHKEQGGGDHLAVGWQLPSGTMERPIGGDRLAPYDGTGTISQELWTNVHGTGTSSIPLHRKPDSTSKLTRFEARSNIGDNYGQRIRGFVRAPETGNYTFWIAADDVAELWLSTSEDPAQKVKIAQVDRWTNVRQWTKYEAQQSVVIPLEAGKRYYIEALHKEGGGSDHLAVGWQLPGGSLERPIGGNRLMPYDGTGTILHEFWAEVHGPSISTIPLESTPTRVGELMAFETPSNVGNNYGQRVRGYVRAPETGDYTFWIAADDVAELWLSTSDDPAQKQKIAHVESWTYARQWTRYNAQQSEPIRLQAGRRYYMEALHKEGGGSDNLAVGWQLPGGSLERPIGGNRLSPYEHAPLVEMLAATTQVNIQDKEAFTVYPNPVAPGGMVKLALEEVHPRVRVTFYELSTGRAVLVQEFQEAQHLQLDLKTVAKGLYGVRVVTDNKTWTRKLVVQ
ncbi:T9SS type A sorting domain-containing protein [Pontibacter qinzhouensis]|uniref:T9SS type A sorting domain-containing protein n=1 Tax=Pontibacter qinzhouensis TaxID=2603253 RepID=A0A5C8K1P4_9BACT|nr:PA14 domain-containing protein [Pontibacter qinzhouensis]TXK44138.1 T9SS type A sorting domain-containing protein [Pontibacter qinzhouensis]